MSWNFVFNENEESRLEVSSNIPGLTTKGELAKVTVKSTDDGPNLTSDQTPKEVSESQPTKTQKLHT